MIDNIVKMYPAYNHEDVFRMEVKFAYTLLLMNKTEASIQGNANDTRRRLSKK